MPSELISHDGPGGVVTRAARTISVVVPIRVINPLNKREHWRARAARVRTERALTGAMLVGWPKLQPPCVVTLTRLSPRKFDDDAVPGACKGMRDEIARWFGINDNDPRVQWLYDQEKSARYEVRVDVREIGA